jgi:hypothetical protein
MHNGIDRFPQENVFGHIMLEKPKALVTQQVLDVVDAAGEKIVQADYLMTPLKQLIAKVTSEKSCPSCDDYSHGSSCAEKGMSNWLNH